MLAWLRRDEKIGKGREVRVGLKNALPAPDVLLLLTLEFIAPSTLHHWNQEQGTV
jgi:hypothetical protein